MVMAVDLAGQIIGRSFKYTTLATGEREVNDVTMVLHKKNGEVVVRYGKNNRQVRLKPLTEITAMF